MTEQFHERKTCERSLNIKTPTSGSGTPMAANCWAGILWHYHLPCSYLLPLGILPCRLLDRTLSWTDLWSPAGSYPWSSHAVRRNRFPSWSSCLTTVIFYCLKYHKLCSAFFFPTFCVTPFYKYCYILTHINASVNRNKTLLVKNCEIILVQCTMLALSLCSGTKLPKVSNAFILGNSKNALNVLVTLRNYY